MDYGSDPKRKGCEMGLDEGKNNREKHFIYLYQVAILFTTSEFKEDKKDIEV